MRCHQAKLRMSQYQAEPDKLAGDTELMAHLNDCPNCQLLVQADRSLREAFAVVSRQEFKPAPCFDGMVTRIEALAAESSDPTSTTNMETKEKTVMSKIAKQISRRPRISVSVGIVGVLLLISMLVPYTYQDSVGYEVAFAGVDKNLALDEVKLNELLARLGIEDAVIDVTGCESTCNVKFSEISSPDDTKLLMAAFEQIGHNVVLEQPRVVYETKDGSVFFSVMNKISGDDRCEEIDFNFTEISEDGELHEVVIELLGGEEEAKTIWISSCEAGTERTIDIIRGDCDQLATGEDSEKVMQFVYMGLADGDCDPSMLDSLHAAGCSLIVISECIDGNDGGASPDNTDDEHSADKQSDLPDGYSLGQNYPNPFNPDTKIDFSIAQAGHVTLEVFNIRGQTVATLVDSYMSAGTHTIEWDATNSSGEKVATGIYLYRLIAGDVTTTMKMNLVK